MQEQARNVHRPRPAAEQHLRRRRRHELQGPVILVRGSLAVLVGEAPQRLGEEAPHTVERLQPHVALDEDGVVEYEFVASDAPYATAMSSASTMHARIGAAPATPSRHRRVSGRRNRRRDRTRRRSSAVLPASRRRALERFQPIAARRRFLAPLFEQLGHTLSYAAVPSGGRSEWPERQLGDDRS
jgi:hypothetical protein